MSAVITLLSDFGWQDVYVGVMKGVIAAIAPKVMVVDLTHAISAQDVASGGFQLANAVPYFPYNTVHVAVIDPGVGGARRAVAVECECGIFVVPDNGLLSQVCDRFPAKAAVELNNPDYWRVPCPSRTFHGRDIFAPVGAHLAAGVSLLQVGSPIDPATLMLRPIPRVQKTETCLEGIVQACDRFGNLITNIPGELVDELAAGEQWVAIANDRTVPGGLTYGDVAEGEVVALVGSHGWIELAVNGGNARDQLHVQCDDRVEIQWLPGDR
ncbi:MAG: S-adenosyl-l-methionine hydroxide adenosyltransferase family protein [Synechococcus sp.]